MKNSYIFYKIDSEQYFCFRTLSWTYNLDIFCMSEIFPETSIHEIIMYGVKEDIKELINVLVVPIVPYEYDNLKESYLDFRYAFNAKKLINEV